MTPASAALAGLALALTASTAVWVASLVRRDASLADICWGPGFALLAWSYAGGLSALRGRPLLLATLITLWAARLAVHIARRHRGHGEDPRYAAMRAAHGPAFWWRSLFVVFWLQAVLLWFIALPVLVVAEDAGAMRLTATDVAGVLVFVAGFACEAVADWQLTRFKTNPANRGQVLETGLWRYSRHPNYFGDALLWWGLFLVACASPRGWMTVASPALMTFLLLRVSGVTLLERGLASSKPGYADYVRRTSAFVPWRPKDVRR